jgi:hypothetical protein
MTYSDSPATDIRKWLWNELQAKGIMSSSDYNITGIGALVPIVPVQQQPELMDKIGGKPFITYDFVTEYVESDMWIINCEQILFTVWCDNFAQATKIKNLMIDLFRRQDESARDLNGIATTGLAYLNVTIISNSWTTAERSDNGRQSFDMVIEVKYVRDLAGSRYA